MQFEEALQFYKQQRRKILAQHFADFIISWDMQTDAAPQSISADAEYGAVLSEYSYELVSDEKFVEAVETLDGNRQLLDDVLCHEVEVMKKKHSSDTQYSQGRVLCLQPACFAGVPRVRQGKDGKRL